MPRAADLAVTNTESDVVAAARSRARIRIAGTVTKNVDGYSASYRNRTLEIAAAGTAVRVTASPSSRLGNAETGTFVDLAATMTGIADLADGIYVARDAQLIALVEQ